MSNQCDETLLHQQLTESLQIEKGGQDEITYHARNVFVHGGLTFTSTFDSGNLKAVSKISDTLFEITTAVDCAGTAHETTLSTWMYFAVTGATAGQEISFRWTNQNKHTGLYDNDMRPVFKSYSKSQRPKKWERVKKKVLHTVVNNASVITFTHRFENTDEIRFAFCAPYSLTDLETNLFTMESTIASEEDIYWKREVLIHSLDGRNVELITLSSKEGIMDETEEPLLHCFPNSVQNNRARKFQNKKIIFISARVHPGETPASYMLHGLLDFLLRKNDPRAIVLRREFVFKIIPILNPDGVSRGHYRADNNGANLNRYYQEPSVQAHPSIYAAKQLVLAYHARNDLLLYLDLHAHATKRGCFMYGNHLNTLQRQVQTQLYAKMVELSSLFFEYEQCNFTEKNMKSKDKRDAMSKEGSGRVSLYRSTQLTYIYTVECNYNMGRKPVSLPKASHDGGCASPGVPRKLTPPKYNTESWKEVGKGLLLGLLELTQLNPWSRIPHSMYHSHTGLKHVLQLEIQRELPHAFEKWNRMKQKERTNSGKNILDGPVRTTLKGAGTIGGPGTAPARIRRIGPATDN